MSGAAAGPVIDFFAPASRSLPCLRFGKKGEFSVIISPTDQGYYEPDTSALLKLKMEQEYGFVSGKQIVLTDKVNLLGTGALPFWRWLEGSCRTPAGLGKIQVSCWPPGSHAGRVTCGMLACARPTLTPQANRKFAGQLREVPRRRPHRSATSAVPPQVPALRHRGGYRCGHLWPEAAAGPEQLQRGVADRCEGVRE